MNVKCLPLIAICSSWLFLLPGAGTAYSDNSQAIDGSAWKERSSELKIAVCQGAQYKRAGTVVELSEGSMLLEAVKPAVIKTPLSLLEVRCRGLVFVRVSTGAERIFVFLESARLICGKHFVGLGSGEEAYVADHEPQVREILVDDAIGRRRARVVKLGEGKGLAMSEFSMVQAMEREPVIYQVIHSGDPQDLALRDKLVKTAAVLNYVTSRHGQYSGGNR